MSLSLVLLLISALNFRHHGSEAQINKFQPSSSKEQNGSQGGDQRAALTKLASQSEQLGRASESDQKRVHDHQHEKIITISEDGFVQSPRFPQSYPRDVVLVWRLIAADENMQIQLTFDERFGLEEPENGLCKFDFVEIEDLSDGTIIGRWCGTNVVPGIQISRANQVRIRFRSDEYLASKPGFCIYYSLLEPAHFESPTVVPPSPLSLDGLNEAVSGFDTVEELIKYLEPERWQLDLEDLYKPTWQMLGKAFVHGRKSRVDLNLLKEEVKLYSCTPRNMSVSLREELKRTDTIYWPGCLLVKRCGGNCACCSLGCQDCQCVPIKVSKKYHEVLQLRYRSPGKPLQKSLADVGLEHHEECDCVCKGKTGG
ncbi:platelet-derived growth factor C isoform X2 [Heptranchias perlo]|uniref:platelet-derived growth factor C isoform X2 n=1 Tax=Heptranchias perlo TaxID=212740 RepID=UPI00355A8766